MQAFWRNRTFFSQLKEFNNNLFFLLDFLHKVATADFKFITSDFYRLIYYASTENDYVKGCEEFNEKWEIKYSSYCEYLKANFFNLYFSPSSILCSSF